MNSSFYTCQLVTCTLCHTYIVPPTWNGAANGSIAQDVKMYGMVYMYEEVVFQIDPLE